MHFLPSFLLLCSSTSVLAQQYAGDIISANLPTIPNAEVAFFKIDDPSGKNDALTLINYYSHGTDGNRIVESKIQRAVIVLHGLLRDPWNYENDVCFSRLIDYLKLTGLIDAQCPRDGPRYQCQP
jgi:hypothetical protein